MEKQVLGDYSEAVVRLIMGNHGLRSVAVNKPWKDGKTRIQFFLLSDEGPNKVSLLNDKVDKHGRCFICVETDEGTFPLTGFPLAESLNEALNRDLFEKIRR